MLEFVYFRRAGDEDVFAKFNAELENQTDAELNQRFESALQCGIVGVHSQGIYLFCLWKKGRERNLPFATDPEGGIQITQGRIICLHPLGGNSPADKA